MSRLNPVGDLLTRPRGARPSGIDHPVDAGAPAVVLFSGATTAPPMGVPVAATPFRLSAQIRDGVAMFGVGIQAVSTPLIGAGASAGLAQITAGHKLRTPGSSGVAAQALDVRVLHPEGSA